MKHFIALLPFALTAFAIAPQANPSPVIQKPGGPPPGCSSTYSGEFGLGTEYLPGEPATTNVASAAHRRMMKRTPPQEGPASPLSSTLEDGVLRDGDQRFGYIAANHQYQYDNPIQAGALYTTGWSICPNNTLALGSTTVFYQCISGDFYNLYDTPVRSGCIPINLQVIPASGSSAVAPTGAATSYTSSAASTYSAPSTPASTPAPPTTTPTTAPPPPPTTTAVSSAPAATVPSSAPSYTGAAVPLALDGSFFAVAAGALGLAFF